MVLGPVLVTVEPARIPKLFAVPSVGAVACAHADWNDRPDKSTAITVVTTRCGVRRGRVCAGACAFIHSSLIVTCPHGASATRASRFDSVGVGGGRPVLLCTEEGS